MGYFNDNFLENMQMLSEAYFGKTKEIQNLIDQLGIIRSKSIRTGSFNSKVNMDSEMQKFNRMMEDQFGFGTFALTVSPNGEYNACTIPIGGRIGEKAPKGKLKCSKTGYKYDKSEDYTCVVYCNSGLFNNEDITDTEVFAILMHEIGHNFQSAITTTGALNGIVTKLNNVYIILISPILIMLGQGKVVANSTKSGAKFFTNLVEDMKRNNSALLKVVGAVSTGKNFITKMLGEITIAISMGSSIINPVGYLANGAQSIVKKIYKYIYNPLDFFTLGLGFKDEQTADAFVAAYGLSSDLISAFDKMAKGGYGYTAIKFKNECNIFNYYWGVLDFPVHVVNGLLYPHPETSARLYEQIKYLRDELNREGIDPKLKKVLEKDIEELERITDKYFKDTTSDPINRSYGKFLYNYLRGDLRNASTDKLYDQMDNAYKNNLN